MKYNLLSICVLFLSLSSLFVSAQSKDVKIRLGQPFPTIDSFNKNYMSNDEHIVTIKTLEDYEYVIQSFNQETLKQISSNNYKLPDLLSNPNTYFESCLEINNRFFAFFSAYNQEGKTFSLYKVEIEAKTAKPLGKPQQIISPISDLRNEKYRLKESSLKDKEVLFSFIKNTTNNKVIIHSSLKQETKKWEESHLRKTIYVFDENLNEEWSQKITMPKTENLFTDYQYLATNDNSVLILAKIYGGPKTSYSIFSFNKNSSNMVEKPLSLKDGYISDAKLSLLKSGEVTMGGFYCRDFKLNGSNGSFLSFLDDQGNITKLFQNDFSYDLLIQNEKKKEVTKIQEAKNSGEDIPLWYLEVNSIKELKDGNILVLGEQHYSLEKSRTRNGYTFYFIEHHFNSIILANHSPTGNLEWTNKIAKKQKAISQSSIVIGTDLSCSFHFVEDENEYHLLFQDNEKNKSLLSNTSPKTYLPGTGVLMNITINNKTGEQTRESLFDLKYLNRTTLSQTWMYRFADFKNNKVAFEAYKKDKEDIWIQLDFN